MRDLPTGLRWYLCTVYTVCLLLVLGSIAAFERGETVWHASHVLLPYAAVFLLLTYAGERTMLQVAGSVSQTMATAVHVAVILLFPAPFPLLITVISASISQAIHGRPPLCKRLFNVCHPTIVVGISSLVFSQMATPTALLHPGHVLAAIPALTFLTALYYILDTATMLALLSLLQRLRPWHVWWQSYRRPLLPELAACTIGIIAAVAWRYDPVLLALFVLPVVALRVAFRAIAAEERAASLRQRSEQLEAVLAAGQHLGLQHTRIDLMQRVAEAARTVSGAATVAAYLQDEENPAMLKRVGIVPDGMAGPVAPAHVPIAACARGITEVESAEPTLLVPLELEGPGIVGLLRLGSLPAALGHDGRDALAILAAQANIALQNAQMHERALAQASEDGLTGLLNHRAFQTRLEEEVARARRGGHPLALIMVDLDDFGAVNNTYGHQTGDATLAAVGRTLRENVRGVDVAARYGGDEFAVILPETAMTEALEVAGRVHAAIAALTVLSTGVPIRVNTSVGVAALPLHARSREELVRAADQAAYAAKHAGKGRVSRPEEAPLTLERGPVALAEQLKNANLATVEALAAAVDAKDPYTRGHSQRVSAYAGALAGALGWPEAAVARVRLAGLLHDVGKIGVPDAILTKPGALDDEEFTVLQQHPEIGERMLGAVPFLRAVLPAVRHHHERWDGQGYPDGLAGGAIPQDAAILMVADSFDAMTSSRTYRPALPLGEARRRVREGSGVQFDPTVVAAFERTFGDDVTEPLSIQKANRKPVEKAAWILQPEPIAI